MLEETEFGYRRLESGDVRKNGDEVRMNTGEVGGIWCQGELRQHEGQKRYLASTQRKFAPWLPVCLLGHAILLSDLMVAEFRRPIL